MVYAKVLNTIAEQELERQAEEKRIAAEKRLCEAREATKRYCHEVLSKKMEQAARNGEKSISIDVSKPYTNGIFQLYEYETNTYNRVGDEMILSVLEEILNNHSYNVQKRDYRYCTYCSLKGYSKGYSDGYRIIISW